MKLFRRKPKSENTSGISPSGHAVLLRPYEPELKATSLIIPDHVRRRTAIAEMRAEVIAVGPKAWDQEAKFFGLIPCPRARVGDKVIISAYCGAILQGPADGKQYRACNDEDIFAVIFDENLDIARDSTPIRNDAADALHGANEAA